MSTPNAPSVLEPLAQLVRSSGVDLVIVTGDVTDQGAVAELKGAARLLRTFDAPVRLIPGKHDHFGDRENPDIRKLVAVDPSLDVLGLTAWERVLGPRWWSMNLGDLHIVALDSPIFGAELDGRQRLNWLAADLAVLSPGTSVVLCVHESPDRAFCEALKRRAPHVKLAAVLAGHWHAPRAVSVDGTLHFSTGPATFSGRDGSPPQARIVTFLPEGVRSQTLVPDGLSPQKSRCFPPGWAWHSRVARGHGLQLCRHPAGLVATSADYDRGTGRVTLVGERTGKIRWSWTCRQPIASAAAVDHEGAVYVQTVGGVVVRIEDGEATWMVEAPDPVASRVSSRPLLTGSDGVLVESPGVVRCLRSSDGQVAWAVPLREAGSRYIHLTGRMCDGLAVLPLAGAQQGLAAMDPVDGSILWSDSSGAPHPTSSPVPLGDGTAVVTRGACMLECFNLESGRIRWRVEVDGPLTAADPVLIDELVLLVTVDAAIHIIDSKTGWLLRTHRLAAAQKHVDAKLPDAVVEAVVGVGRHLHVITVTGRWWRLDPFHWEPELVAFLPVAVTAPPVWVEKKLVLAGREGILLAAHLQDAAADTILAANHGPSASDAQGSRRASRGADRWRRSLRLPRLG